MTAVTLKAPARRRRGAQQAGRIAVLVLAAVLLAAGALTYQAQRDQQVATSRVMLTAHSDPTRPDPGYDPGAPAFFTGRIESYSVLIGSENFLRRVITENHLDVTPDQLRAATTVTAPPDTTIVQLTVQMDRSHDVRAIADAVAAEFADAVTEVEKPTPVSAMVIAPVRATEAYRHSAVRNAVLAVLAALTVLGLARLCFPELNKLPAHQPSENRNEQRRPT